MTEYNNEKHNNSSRSGRVYSRNEGAAGGNYKKADGRKNASRGGSNSGNSGADRNFRNDRNFKADRNFRNDRYVKNEGANLSGDTEGEDISLQERDEHRSELMVEGRNAVLEAIRTSDKIDKLYVQEGVKDGPVNVIVSEAKKKGILTVYVPKDKLDAMSDRGKHQGVILNLSAVVYAEVEDILARAEERGEKPFIFVLDGIEDPHNLGAIIRTANLSGAHGVIIPKHRSATVNATVAKCSAGAVYHTLIAKVTNIGQTIDYLKEKGIWFACADMGGEVMYDLNLTGAIGLVIGNEGEGVSRLVREKCDFIAGIPMKGDIDSLNASVAAGILAWEVVRQNYKK